MPLAWKAQTIQQAKKIMAIAAVMFRSALPPRSSGLEISNPCQVGTPQPMVPTPGMSPNQFVNRMKMKTVAKNQNVLFTRSEPMMPSRNSWSASTSHSRKFCAPAGTSRILRVANRAKTMRPSRDGPGYDHRTGNKGRPGAAKPRGVGRTSRVLPLGSFRLAPRFRRPDSPGPVRRPVPAATSPPATTTLKWL